MEDGLIDGIWGIFSGEGGEVSGGEGFDGSEYDHENPEKGDGHGRSGGNHHTRGQRFKLDFSHSWIDLLDSGSWAKEQAEAGRGFYHPDRMQDIADNILSKEGEKLKLMLGVHSPEIESNAQKLTEARKELAEFIENLKETPKEGGFDYAYANALKKNWANAMDAFAKDLSNAETAVAKAIDAVPEIERAALNLEKISEKPDSLVEAAKKMSTSNKLLIGGAVVALGGLMAWKYFQNKNPEPEKSEKQPEGKNSAQLVKIGSNEIKINNSVTS